MKTIILILLIGFGIPVSAQDAYQQRLVESVKKLDQVGSTGQYQALANEFSRLANAGTAGWKAAYYAAFCNTKIAWLYREDPDKIEPFANTAEQQILKARSLLDSASQQEELSEVYVVMSMIYRAKVFINPMTNGRKYGPVSQQYLDKAMQLNPENPRANYVAGWVKYYTPKLWGGDKDKARELAETALKQLENIPGPADTSPRWGKTECDDLLRLYK